MLFNRTAALIKPRRGIRFANSGMEKGLTELLTYDVIIVWEMFLLPIVGVAGGILASLAAVRWSYDRLRSC